MPGLVGPDLLRRLDERLAETDRFLEEHYPGEDGRRQPVHTVYVPADRYTRDLPRRWGDEALGLVASHGGWQDLARSVGVRADVADEVVARVEAKLGADPVEDLRLDFEDGYGDRGDEAEDGDAAAAAAELASAVAEGSAPAFVGIRFKCFEAATRERGVRTLGIFLSALLDAGELPAGLVLTFPKVSTVSQVEAMVRTCEALEDAAGLEQGRLGFEIQVETPQLVVGADGTLPVAAAIGAGAGRVTSLHYGTYDYSASLQIAAAHQALDHPAADFAKTVMQAAVAGTGVHLSDGSTNVLPVGDRAAVLAAWQLHHGLVRRSLARGYYQGWDMHPGHLPTRFLATFAFYREGFGSAAGRLSAYVHRDTGGILDEPATARALARYLHRGLVCGAIGGEELVAATGLRPEQVEQLARPRSDTLGITPA